MKIYATGVLQFKPDKNGQEMCQHSRLWVIFDNFEDAERFLMENQTDCFEHYYNYGLIEEHETNTLFKNIPKQWWYKTIVSTDVFFVVKTECPEVYKNTCNWWIG